MWFSSLSKITSRDLRDTGAIAWKSYSFTFPSLFIAYTVLSTRFICITRSSFSPFFHDRAWNIYGRAFMYQGCIDHNSGCIDASASGVIYRSRYIATIYSGIARKREKSGSATMEEKYTEIYGKNSANEFIARSGRSIMLHFISQIMDDVRVCTYMPRDSFSAFYVWSSRLRVQVLYI